MANGELDTTAPSRHARFRQIMDAAAGAAQADYQGYGRFWELPLPRLRQFELYGIPMMRSPGGPPPAGTPSPGAAPASCCCPAPTTPGAPAGASPSPAPSGGGEDAGLVRGLRGQFPFDGTQFPPLPWGGTRVAEADIRFIATWIADGCPGETDDAPHATAGAMVAAAAHALALGEAPHAAFTGPTNQLADDAGRVKARKNVEHLSDDELRRLRNAVAKMKSLDGYYLDERSFGYWGRIHANQCQHGWEEFLTWHRVYLYLFEKQLQDIDPTVTLPYWDWTADIDNVKASLADMGDTNNDNGIVPCAYRCWIDDDGLRKLTDGGKVPPDVLAGLGRIIGKKYSSGARLFTAAGITNFGANPDSDAAIIAVLGEINPLWHWRRWPGGNASLIFQAYPSPEDVEHILGIDNFFTFGSGPMDNQFFGALENIHNLIHNFSGGNSPYPVGPNNEFSTGDMVDPGRTAFDPIFWGHHANVDRLWAEWQRRHPGRGPDNPDAVLPPWNFTVSDTTSISALGYEYVLAAHVFKTDNKMALVRFRSADTTVHSDVLAEHERAEIRLHAVQFVPRPGFYIRAFLNTPDAGLATPTQGNPNFVGQVNMFTGSCVGGPGHCDVPEAPTDKFDRRPRHHKTPSSFRIDATKSVRALHAAGTRDFQVNLVALNLDGSPANDALKLDAVSLNFFD
jgi:tyrosinase